MTDPYHEERQNIERYIKRVQDPNNREIVADFLAEKEATGVKVTTVSIYAYFLGDFANFLSGIPAREATRSHYRDYFKRPAVAGGKDLAPKSRYLRNQAVRLFARWLHDSPKEDPPQVDGLIGKPPKLALKIPSQLITSDDLKRLLQNAPDLQTKAMVFFFWDVGPRVSEAIALNVGSVRDCQVFSVAAIPPDAPYLKTGPRDLRATSSHEHLQAWLAVHPERNHPDAPLFGMIRGKGVERHTRDGVQKVLQRLGARAKLGKRTNPHIFRHSAATEKGRLGWDDDTMRFHFGWTTNSNMPSHYRRNTAAEIETKILRAAGIFRPSETDTAMVPLMCPYCGSHVPAVFNCCGMCGRRVRQANAAEAMDRAKRREDLIGEAADLLAKLSQARPPATSDTSST